LRISRVMLGAIFVAGCSDSPGAPSTVGESGSLSFAFTGARGAGTYTAAGALPSNHAATLGTNAWASSQRDDTTSTLTVIGSIPHTSQTWDLATLELPRLTPGTDSIDISNCSSETCAEVWSCSEHASTISRPSISASCLTGASHWRRSPRLTPRAPSPVLGPASVPPASRLPSPSPTGRSTLVSSLRPWYRALPHSDHRR
jgi:hypothetical protein